MIESPKRKQQDLRIGEAFGRLTITSLPKLHGKFCYYECDCSCGKSSRVRAYDLISGKTQSCRCLSREITTQMMTTHGNAPKGKPSAEYMIWLQMIARCRNPNNKSYPRYGGRGISICDLWADSFGAFFSDMGPKPDGKSIDRVDNDGPYSPENCRWATPEEQGRNTRVNRLLTHNGKTHCVVEWSEITGLTATAIRQRLDKLGWSVEKTLSTPPCPRVKRRGKHAAKVQEHAGLCG